MSTQPLTSELAAAVARSVSNRQARAALGDPQARAERAVLARAATLPLGADAEALALVVPVVPAALRGRGPAPSAHEQAAAQALMLHALHAGARGCQRPHRRGISLGAAYAQLWQRDRHSKQATERRFTHILGASDLTALSAQLRRAVAMLGDAGIGLDYGQLAGDLVAFADPLRRHQTRLAWGRDFYATTRTNTEQDAA